MRYFNIIMCFCYSFVVGVAASIIVQPSETLYQYFYIISIIAGCTGLALFVITDIFEIFRLHQAIIFIVAGLSGISLGMGRFVHNKIIPPFVNDPDYPNHIVHFVDEDRNALTIVVGRIAMAPEMRFMKYGDKVDILFKPEVVIPEPGDNKEYLVGEGYIQVSVSANVGEIYPEIASSQAYGYRVQFEGALLRFEPTTVPYTLDLREYFEKQNIFAKMNFYRLKTGEEIKILKDPKTGLPHKGNFVFEWSMIIKDKILKVIKQTTPYPYSAFLAGVTLGLRRGLEQAYNIFEKEKKYKTKFDLITEEFRWSGTSHVLAVSGLHVTIITVMLYGLFAVFRVPKKISSPLIIFSLIIFTIITGARPSSIRATIMNSLVVVSEAYLGIGLKTSLLFGIGIACFSELIFNPKLIFEPAFSLSFMAVLSLALITGPADRFLKRKTGKRTLGGIIGFYTGMILGSFLPGPSTMIFIFIGIIAGIYFGQNIIKLIPRWLMQFIASQFAIQFGMMLPLSAYYFNHLPVAGPIANIVAIPLIGIIVQLGMIAGIIGTVIPSIGIYIALMLNATNYLCMWVFMAVTHLSTITMPYPYMKTFTPKLVAFYYSFLGVLLIIDKVYPDLEVWYYKKLAQATKYLKQRIYATAITGFIILFVIPAIIWREPYQKYDGNLQVNFLDVGYGSAMHIKTPQGKNFLVNGGRFGKYDRDGGFDLADFKIVPYFYKQRIGILDGVFITSINDEDISGLISVVDYMIVDKIYSFFDSSEINIYKKWDELSREIFEKIGDSYLAENCDKFYIRNKAIYYRDIIEKANTPFFPFEWFDHLAVSTIRFIKELFKKENKRPDFLAIKKIGTIIYEEEFNGKKLRIYTLNPDWENPSSNASDMSIVLKIEYGRTGIILLNALKKSGDSKILRFRNNLKADVMQVPSHGSKDACSDALIRAISPEIAILEFGYPRHLYKRLRTEAIDDADYTTLKLQGNDIKVYRTDKVGSVLIISDGEKILEPLTFKGRLEEEPEKEGITLETLPEF
ncbi:MAG: ComEC/Rec2 family competence protein [Candidatus Hydrogenedentota bacterium]